MPESTALARAASAARRVRGFEEIFEFFGGPSGRSGSRRRGARPDGIGASM
jgi:hypothetical protein